MSIVAVVPARAGSVRCPGKNKALLGSQPLIVWTLIRAKYSGIFDEILVTTDDPDVATIAATHGGCTVIDRPGVLAQSDTPMLPVVRHAISTLDLQPDLIVLLQPTSPFRAVDDIHKSYDLIKECSGDAVVSVTEPPGDLVFELGHAKRMRPVRHLVVPNGALYLLTGQHMRSGGDWYSGLTYAYPMPKERSLDIDTELDLEIARLMLRQGVAA